MTTGHDRAESSVTFAGIRTGINTTMTWVKSQAVSAILGLGPEVVGMLTMLKVGQCINIVFSAMLAKAVINGVQGDTFKRWVHK